KNTLRRPSGCRGRGRATKPSWRRTYACRPSIGSRGREVRRKKSAFRVASRVPWHRPREAAKRESTREGLSFARCPPVTNWRGRGRRKAPRGPFFRPRAKRPPLHAGRAAGRRKALRGPFFRPRANDHLRAKAAASALAGLQQHVLASVTTTDAQPDACLEVRGLELLDRVLGIAHAILADLLQEVAGLQPRGGGRRTRLDLGDDDPFGALESELLRNGRGHVPQL